MCLYAAALLGRMLRQDPARRVAPEDALGDPWITDAPPQPLPGNRGCKLGPQLESVWFSKCQPHEERLAFNLNLVY